MFLIKWLHHLFNPHCPDCLEKEMMDKECNNCNVLKDLLEKERFEKRALLDRLLYVPEKNIQEEPKEEFKPITPARSLRIVRENLERESLRSAQLLKEKEKEMQEVEKLEKELLPEIEVK